MEETMRSLTINEELKNLLPPLSEEEYAGLEADILERGCLTPLFAWGDILVEGHNRYEICQKHRLPYKVNEIEFDSLDAAKLWAWQHQKNRRNMTSYQRAELSLRFKDAIAAKAKDRQGTRSDLADGNIPQTFAECKETRQELAEIADVSHTTLNKVEYISEHADEETKEKLRKGEKGTSINKEYNRLKEEAAETNGNNTESESTDTENVDMPPSEEEPVIPYPNKDKKYFPK